MSLDMKWLVGLILLWVLYPCYTQAQLVPVPDTTDWREYYPLQIGNAWEYKYGNEIWGEYPEGYQRREIIGDTLIGQERYFLHQVTFYDAAFAPFRSSIDYLRYDTTHTAIVALVQEDSVAQEQPWPDPNLACDLSADFFSEFACYNCPHCSDVTVYGDYDEHIIFSVGELESTIVKMFTHRGSGFGVGFVHGIGAEIIDADFEWGYRNDLIFVRLGGEEYGFSEVATTVERDKGALPQSLSIVSIFPNPLRAKATVEYELSSPQEVSLQVYNLIGQQVQNLELGWRTVGVHRAEIETYNLSSGVYLLRILSNTGSHVATQVLLQR